MVFFIAQSNKIDPKNRGGRELESKRRTRRSERMSRATESGFEIRLRSGVLGSGRNSNSNSNSNWTNSEYRSFSTDLSEVFWPHWTKIEKMKPNSTGLNVFAKTLRIMPLSKEEELKNSEEKEEEKEEKGDTEKESDESEREKEKGRGGGRGKDKRVSEVVIGDETGRVTLLVQGTQNDHVKEECEFVVIFNAHISMTRRRHGFMHLIVDEEKAGIYTFREFQSIWKMPPWFPPFPHAISSKGNISLKENSIV